MDHTLTRNDYLGYLMDAAARGTLLTDKHNPDNLTNTHDKYRSITGMPPDELASYIAAGDFDMRAYENHDPRHPPYFLELIPTNPAVVPGSGIPAFSTTPTHACDRFI